MSKIIGIIGESNNQLIKVMAKKMEYEDNYKTDFYIDDEAIFAIIRFEYEKNYIVIDKDNSIIGIMDGEIFGKEIQNPNYFIYLYKKKNMEEIRKINGWFVTIIWDKIKKKLIIISDIFGFKPFYYIQVNKKFIFSSEIKAIIAHPDVKIKLNHIAIAEFSMFNYPLGERTFIEGIERVPPASIYTYFDGNLIKSTYCEFKEFLQQKKFTKKESIELGAELFCKCVEELIQNDRVGVALTGGYDTRAILSTIDCKKYNVHAFTYENIKKEVEIAKKVADVACCNHIVHKFEEDFFVNLHNIIEKSIYITDGNCNINQSFLLYVFNKEKTFSDVVITGILGSEIIRGLQDTGLTFNRNLKKLMLSKYPEESIHKIIVNNYWNLFKIQKIDSVIDAIKNDVVKRWIKGYSLRERALLLILFEIARKYYSAEVVLESSQVKIRLPYLYPKFLKFIIRTPFSALSITPFSNNFLEKMRGQFFSAKIINYNNKALTKVITDRGYSPFCNLYKFGYPVILFNRIKRRHTFSKPIYENYFENYVRNILSNNVIKNQEYYDTRKIKLLLEQNKLGIETWIEISKVASFDLWLRKFIL